MARAIGKKTFNAIEKYCLLLPGTGMVVQWGGHHVFKVGGKVFALLAPGQPGEVPALSFKVDAVSFDILTRIEDITQAPYFAKGQWVCAWKLECLPLAETKIYINRSYNTVAAKLTRKQRVQLRIGS